MFVTKTSYGLDQFIQTYGSKSLNEDRKLTILWSQPKSTQPPAVDESIGPNGARSLV